MDRLNSLFNSDRIEDLFEFYEYFNDRDELIKWMIGRPYGNAKIHDYYSESKLDEIVVLVLTADYMGTKARNIREHIFNDFHIIFVESGYKDPFFNIARNANVGLKYINSNYRSRWIIMCSDDMIKLEDPINLVKKLVSLKRSVDGVYISRSRYHSIPGFIGKPNRLYKYTTCLRGTIARNIYNIREKLAGEKYLPLTNKFINKLLYTKHQEAIWFIDFGILGSAFVKRLEGKVFDETYINSEEDADLSMRIFSSRSYEKIDFDIGEQIGGTLGIDNNRYIRGLASNCYFSYKVEKGLL